MKTTYAGPERTALPGQCIRLPDAEGRELVLAGHATEVQERRPATTEPDPVKPARVETAAIEQPETQVMRGKGTRRGKA